MASTKLKTTHNYLTLTVMFANGSKLNLTVSQSGVKASGTKVTIDQLRPAMNAFDAALERTGLSYGEGMARLEQVAKTVLTVEELIAQFKLVK